MAQHPYMGPGLLFSRLLSRAHSWQLVVIGQLAALLFYRSWCVRQSHLAGNQETWARNGGNLAYETFHKQSADPKCSLVLRIFITLKNPSPSVGIEPANLGSSGGHWHTVEGDWRHVIWCKITNFLRNIQLQSSKIYFEDGRSRLFLKADTLSTGLYDVWVSGDIWL
jgi:hypothetical protein